MIQWVSFRYRLVSLILKPMVGKFVAQWAKFSAVRARPEPLKISRQRHIDQEFGDMCEPTNLP